MKSKPDRYGIKIWAIAENPSGYVWKSQVYTGQQGNFRKKARKTSGFRHSASLGQGDGITCDNFFTSLELATELNKQKKNLLGNLGNNIREVPKDAFPFKSRPLYSSIFRQTMSGMLVSYLRVKNRAVILLSSQHQTASVSSSETKKPTVILDYNAAKGEFDTADKMLKEFSCHRISKR